MTQAAATAADGPIACIACSGEIAADDLVTDAAFVDECGWVHAARGESRTT